MKVLNSFRNLPCTIWCPVVKEMEEASDNTWANIQMFAQKRSTSKMLLLRQLKDINQAERLCCARKKRIANQQIAMQNSQSRLSQQASAQATSQANSRRCRWRPS